MGNENLRRGRDEGRQRDDLQGIRDKGGPRGVVKHALG